MVGTAVSALHMIRMLMIKFIWREKIPVFLLSTPAPELFVSSADFGIAEFHEDTPFGLETPSPVDLPGFNSSIQSKVNSVENVPIN